MAKNVRKRSPAKMATDMSDPPSRQESVVGSETGYRLESEPDRYRDISESTEETGLLGAGTHDDGDDNGHIPNGTHVLAADQDFDHLPPWRRPSVWWLLGPYALYTLAFGGSIVPKLNLIIDLVCRQYFIDQDGSSSGTDPHHIFAPIVLGGDNPQCRIPGVQRDVATFTLALSVIIGILTMYTAPKLGSLSDRYGRKNMMVICSMGGVGAEVITILAAKYPEVVHYRWMLLGSVIDGLSGSFTAGSVLSHSYTSDCTPPSKRSVSISYLHGCLFSGLAFGPLLAAYFVKKTGSLLFIFYLSLGCHLFFILFIFFIIPESLSKRKQRLAREKHAKEREMDAEPPAWVANLDTVAYGSGLGSALYSMKSANPFAPLKALLPPGAKNAKLRRNLVTLAVIDMILLGSVMSMGTITILYSEFVFGWGTVESSRFISLVSSVRFVVLMLIFPVINYVFRTRPAARRRRESSAPIVEKNAGADKLDIWVLRSALLSDVIGAFGYILVRTQGLFVLCAIVTAFGGLASTTVQASISKHVPSESLGKLLGAIGLLHALSRVIAPIVFNGLYAATVDTFPQAFFVLMFALFVVVLVATFLVRPHVYLDEEHESAPPSPVQGPDPALRQDELEDDELIHGLR